ncbi:MAG: hypothetical protein A2V77_11295 [Anaeromyxobacter sp. RBG_16_69_14]|nr:MAG: hypothetical protein A2V77_11295 [Anaeromyxobacter sp. RBG_16_69_14]
MTHVDRAYLGPFGRLRLGEVGEVVIRTRQVAARVAAELCRRGTAHVFRGDEPISFLLLGFWSLSRLRRRLRRLETVVVQVDG